ncbi:succinylglutamate desuccinylase/aspartoacylase family protein [Natronorarus salvus]|uniref:succinylglutamate desuccinylase/aspartoacylase family protein n=1 Tax=Natronorarus salvus TaxID=3117733 RepID=UPI002F2607AD
MEIGTAHANRGERSTGTLEVTELPTGGPERVPIGIVAGETGGPTLWVTAAIHGDEVTALAVAQDAFTTLDPASIRGTLVCMPTTNPAGLRRNERTSYYHDDDPNRFFPDADHDSARPPRVQEVIDRRLSDAITASADALLDLHTAQVGSVPFTIRDRVLYGERRSKSEAEALATDLDRLAEAFGLPVVTEYAAEEYVEEGLHRSTAGSVLNGAGIPAITPELGGHSVVDEDTRTAGLAGVFRTLVELDMLDSVPEPVSTADPGYSPPVDFPVRRAVGPHADRAGIVRHRVEPGEAIGIGETVAEVVSPHGEVLSAVESRHEGYVLARKEGVAVYENDPLYSLAVRDNEELVVPRPED